MLKRIFTPPPSGCCAAAGNPHLAHELTPHGKLLICIYGYADTDTPTLMRAMAGYDQQA